MRFSDILVKHIYNVIFDQVRPCEFNGRHLALVLKRNNDRMTYIVMPLTSEPNGDGVNKVKLGTISSLPSSLRGNDTYAVFNQIRTVNADRFISLKEGTKVVQSKIDDEIFNNLLSLGISELLYNLTQDEKFVITKKVYDKECVVKAKDLAYTMLKMQKEIENREEEIIRIKKEIQDILANVAYTDICNTLEQRFIDEGIKDILDDLLKSSSNKEFLGIKSQQRRIELDTQTKTFFGCKIPTKKKDLLNRRSFLIPFYFSTYITFKTDIHIHIQFCFSNY